MKNRKLQFLPALVLLLSVLSWMTAHAQITPLGDAYTNSADPTTNYGSATLLYVDGAKETAYIQFNLASIPSGAVVSQATLKLYVNAVTTAGTFNVDYVNGSWSESTLTYDLAPALGSTIVSSVDITTADKNQYILINITPAVQAWLNGSEANDGIALVANSTFSASFDSKENTTTSHPAELDIVFAGDGTITGVTTASGSGLTGGGTSGTLSLGLTTECSANQVLQWSGSAWACAAVGTGTITGVTAGTALTGGGTSGNVTLNLNTSDVPLLAASNAFTGNQTVNGNLSATGVVTGNSFQIGSNLFAFGTYSSTNAFLGFAGNTTMTGNYNIATGEGALVSNTTGSGNTASGGYALYSNTTGSANTATGDSALAYNTTGVNNTATGELALESNTGGFDNTATGQMALTNNTTGNYNTATGEAAMVFNSTGNANTATGFQALYENTTGGNNEASGFYALFSNTTGLNNTASGFQALYANTTGNYNAAVGDAAGSTVDGSKITASNNSFLGTYTALSTGTLNNATAIGSNAEVGESNALVLGAVTGVNGGTSVNVGIGTTMPAYMLDVHGTGNFTGLVTFASGQTFPGTGTITGVTSGSGLSGGGSSGAVTLTNTGILALTGGTGISIGSGQSPTISNTGILALTGGTGISISGGQSPTISVSATQVPLLNAVNTFSGNQTVNGNLSATGVVTGSSFQIGSNLFDYGSYASANAFLGFAGNGTAAGTNNTASGFQALYGNTGSSNTASGVGALGNNNTGSFNTASGALALYINTAGNYNTASGFYALGNNDTGSNNTATGYEALYLNSTTAGGPAGSNNTASGYQALYSNTTGSNNEASGYQALLNNTTGGGNTADGYEALESNTTASYSTAMGYQALLHSTGAGNTGVGYNSLYSTTSGTNNTGFGNGALGGNSTGSFNTAVGYNAGPASGGLTNATAIGAYAEVTQSNSLVLGAINGVNGATSSTNIGIGTTAPSYIFTIAQSSGPAISAGWEVYSSRRWKTNIQTLHGALGKVEQLRGVSYDLKDSGKHQIGVIAEEVGRVVPEVVNYEKNGKDAQGVDYSRLTALLIEAVKQQQKQIQKQQRQIALLTGKVSVLESALRTAGQGEKSLSKIRSSAVASETAELKPGNAMAR